VGRALCATANPHHPVRRRCKERGRWIRDTRDTSPGRACSRGTGTSLALPTDTSRARQGPQGSCSSERRSLAQRRRRSSLRVRPPSRSPPSASPNGSGAFGPPPIPRGDTVAPEMVTVASASTWTACAPSTKNSSLGPSGSGRAGRPPRQRRVPLSPVRPRVSPEYYSAELTVAHAPGVA